MEKKGVVSLFINKQTKNKNMKTYYCIYEQNITQDSKRFDLYKSTWIFC